MPIIRKIKELLLKFMACGLTPQKMALTVAFGVTLGILPILWGTTLLCAAAAALFRLNQAGIQVINYLSYPLQFALLIPFYRVGEKLFPQGTQANAASGNSATWFNELLSSFGMGTLKAVAVWLMVAPFVMFVLYATSLILFRRKLHPPIEI